MQQQCDIRIFRRIIGGFFQRDLIKRQLLFAFPGDIFKGGGFVIQMTVGQAVHIMTSGDTVEHIGFQHGIEGDSAQFHTVIFHNPAIKLQVLTDFPYFFIFQNRFHHPQHLLS